ncbi:DUF3598 family protein [Synechococcus sp. MW101C3]|jgi:hypothetical protein|uniref:DUF3598 family protein n=1 Tax=Synechococcus sp. MW101C3 TaxID=210768 RepID=UPI000B9949F0|nr:DUF3598 family protein [Synechococcus sp. MW101C3]
MPRSPRQILLDASAGLWEGTFIRLDGAGIEAERFPTGLEVREVDGNVEAALTYRHTGRVATMRFQEPPAEMEISPQGHWSLGPDKVGPWSCLTELCLVHGERRRRVVVRHGAERLEAVVLVVEARPGLQEAAPAAPHRVRRQPAGGSRELWQLEANLQLETTNPRLPGEPLITELRWTPEPGLVHHLQRAYGPHGLPLSQLAALA